MTENPDFDLESDWLIPPVEPAATPTEEVAPEDAAPEAEAAPEPVVVIQYRNRGLHPVLLLPITLIGSLALFTGYHAYLDPAESRPPAQFAPASAPTAGEDVKAAAAEALGSVQALFPPATPLTLEGRPVPHELPSIFPVVAADPRPEPKAEPEPPAPPAEAEAVAVPVEEPSRISIASVSPDLAAKAAAVDPAVDVAAAQDPPAAEPLPTQEEMMERIRQEAELKAMQRDELDRRQQADLEQLKAESAKRADEERDQFRRELRSIIKAGAAGSGQAIEALCDQFGRTYNEGVRQRAYAILARNKGRLTSDAEVRILRSLGVPEPAVLDFLCNRVNRSIHSRNGPHDSDEVRVAAARQLLRIPPTGGPVADPTSVAPPSPARSPAYRRSSP